MTRYSESVEDYLKTLRELSVDGQPVAVSSLAEHLGISTVSVHEMIKRLGRSGLIVYRPYRGVSLTEDGSEVADRVIRRHRLWERFLHDVLGLPWAEVHEEAHRLEHVTTPDLAQRLARFLDDPQSCPHGHPIRDRIVTDRAGQERSLSDTADGESLVIVRLPEHDREVLAYVDRLGLHPETELAVVEAAPFGGPIVIEVQDVRVAIGRDLASEIIVRSA